MDDTIRFAGAELHDPPHICAFFNSRDEEYRALLPFISEGIDRGERAFHIVDGQFLDDHQHRLQSFGIDIVAAQRAGRLDIRNCDDVYLSGDYFDMQRTLASWQGVFDSAVRLGCPLTRVVAHMEWSLEDRRGVRDLLEYEAGCNEVFKGRKDPVICVYDLTRYSGHFIIDVMRTHPMIIIGGILQENPFFVPPDQFIQELRAREAAGPAAVA
jgi:hypothetical protein